MGAQLIRRDGPVPDRAWYRRWYADRGLSPSWWSNEPSVRYATHRHGHRKVLFCVEGGISFHVGGVDHVLRPGDRLEVEAQTPHAATVGPDGVTCVEAAVPPE